MDAYTQRKISDERAAAIEAIAKAKSAQSQGSLTEAQSHLYRAMSCLGVAIELLEKAKQ
jgi:hypothetical protein